MRKLLIAILSIIAICSLSLAVGCTNVPEEPKPQLSNSIVELYVDDQITLSIENYEGEYLWASLNSDVATVTEEGVVTAKYIGTTDIVCYYEGGYLKCNVNVIESKNPVEQARLNATDIVLYRADKYNLKVITNKGSEVLEGGTTVWTSSNENLVTVSNEGVVEAVSLTENGEFATITAVHTFGENVYTLTCKVRVILDVNIICNSNVALYTGYGQYKISPTVTDNEGGNTGNHVLDTNNFEYSIEDESIAEIDQSGVITPKKGGKTRILVNYNDYGYTFIDLLVYNKLIYSKDDFLTIQPSDYSLLMNDIDFTKTTVNGGIKIAGLFNGNGYALNNITLVPNDWESITGKQVFGNVTGEIKNLEVHNLKVKKFWEQMCGASGLMATVSGKVENIILDGMIEGRVAIEYQGTNYTTWGGAKGGYLMKTSNQAYARNIYIDIDRDDSSDDLKVTHGSGTLNASNIYVVPDKNTSTSYATINLVDGGYFTVGTANRFISNNFIDAMDMDIWQLDGDKPVLKDRIDFVDFDPAKVKTLKFETDGGSEIKDVYIKTGETVKSFPESQKERHILKGWMKKGTTSLVSVGLTVTEDMTFVAKWAEAFYAKFDSDGGTLVDDIIVEKDKTLVADGKTKVPAPTKANKALKGWVKEGETELFDFSTEKFTEDMTFVAQWVDTFTCSFDANGGEPISDIKVGDGLYIKTMPTPVRNGYTFIGWHLVNEDVVEEEIFDNTTTPITGATKFQAEWVKNVVLSFNSNGGSSVADVEVGTGLILSASRVPAPLKVGYILLGWVKDGETEIFDFTTNVFNANTSFTAKWQECVNVIDFANANALNSVSGKNGYSAYSITSDIKFSTDSASLKLETAMKASSIIYLDSSDWSKYSTIMFRVSHDAYESSSWFLTCDESKSIWNYKDALDNYGYQLYGKPNKWIEVKLIAKDLGKFDLYYNNVLRAQDVAVKNTFPIVLYNNQAFVHNFYISNVIGVENYATLTFDENYDSKVSYVNVGKGLKIATTIVPKPLRDGYQFLGWVKQGETEIFNFTNASFTVDTIFIASWQQTAVIIDFAKENAISNVTGDSGFTGYSIASNVVYPGETASLKFAVAAGSSQIVYLKTNNWSDYKEISFRLTHDGYNDSSWFLTADTSKNIWATSNAVGSYGFQMYGKKGSWLTVKLVFNENGTYNLYYNNYLRAENLTLGGTFAIKGYNNQSNDHNFYISNVIAVPKSN